MEGEGRFFNFFLRFPTGYVRRRAKFKHVLSVENYVIFPWSIYVNSIYAYHPTILPSVILQFYVKLPLNVL